VRKRPLKELADIRLNGEYNEEELMRLVRLGIACTSGDPKLRPSKHLMIKQTKFKFKWIHTISINNILKGSIMG
jgi:hypothetical protein